MADRVLRNMGNSLGRAGVTGSVEAADLTADAQTNEEPAGTGQKIRKNPQVAPTAVVPWFPPDAAALFFPLRDAPPGAYRGARLAGQRASRSRTPGTSRAAFS